MSKMGSIDIACENSIMSSFVSMTREGQLHNLFHIYSYLKLQHKSRIFMDPTYHKIYEKGFSRHDWKVLYGEVEEVIPQNSPKNL